MNLKKKIHLILHPENYHGEIYTPPFFEGWYFKVVSADRRNAFAFIPGISLTENGENDHAFIQVIDGATGYVEVVEFPIDQFYWDPENFDIYIGDNHFCDHQIAFDIPFRNGRLRASIAFENQVLWPTNLISPGAMGSFGWLTFLECNHGILSLDHQLQGTLEINRTQIDFTGGRGYIEKDWGSSFPKSWIWLQSNQFSQPGISLTVSLATVPLFGVSFTGMIAGLYFQDHLYSFTTYNGAKATVINQGTDAVEILFHRKKHKMLVKANRTKGGSLHAPSIKGMDRRIIEGIDAKIEVKFWINNQLVFADTGCWGGLEIVQ